MIDYQDRIKYFKEKYSETHYHFACLASVPLILSPDLLYKLWRNFKIYEFKDQKPVVISEIAVSDLLMSSLSRPVGYQLYKIEDDARHALLQQLPADQKTQVAHFLQEYAAKVNNKLSRQIREIHQKTAQSILNPKEFAKSIEQSLKDTNEKTTTKLHNLHIFFSQFPDGQTQKGLGLYLEETNDSSCDVEVYLPEDLRRRVKFLPTENLNETTPAHILELSSRIKQAKSTNATQLDLSNLGLTEIPEEIKELDELIVLNLKGNNIKNIEIVSSLKELKVLILDKNKIENFTPLSNLKNLTGLSLAETGIVDLTPLKYLNRLQQLNLSGNNISNIDTIASLEELTALVLDKNKIADFSSLSKLKHLTVLSIAETDIADLTPLKYLNRLQQLNLSGNNITNINPLGNLAILSELYIGNNEITDISPLALLTELKRLDLSANQIADISALQSLTKLEKLNLGGNLFGNKWFDEMFKGSINLTTVKLGGKKYNRNNIKDMLVLQYLSDLNELDLSENSVSNISFLDKLTQLTKLNLRNTEVAQVKHLLPLLKRNEKPMKLALRETDFIGDNEINLQNTPISKPEFLKTIEGEQLLPYFWNTKIFKILLFKDKNCKIDVHKVAKIINDLALVLRAEVIDDAVEFNEPKPITKSTADKYDFFNWGDKGEYRIRILVTDVPYENKFFYDGGIERMILSFSRWGYLTDQPKEMGLLYWLCRFAIYQFHVESAEVHTTHCLNDFLSNKSLIDRNMKNAGVCKNCLQKLKDKPLNSIETLALEDISNLCGYLISISGDGKLQEYQIALQRISEARQNKSINLDLGNLNLTEIPKEIAELTQLQVLHLFNNQIQSLEPLQDLRQLETLYLHHNNITDISPLAGLPHLQTLFLQNNQIANAAPLLPLLQKTNNPPKIGLTTETGIINLANNPLTNPPAYIIKQGNEIVLRYFKLPPAIQQIAQNMKPIKGGTFDMGDVFDDNHDDDEKPVHRVEVGDFYMSAFCVTFAEYDAFCQATGRKKPGDEGWGRGSLPVMNVSWYDAVEYCNWLSKEQGITPAYTINGNNVSCNWSANGYRLPTEAEWEYAAREGGRQVRFGNGQNILSPTEANFDASASYKQPYSEIGEYRRKTVPVNSFTPNALGLYNMSGNVWEWCWDWFDEDYYKNSPPTNPRGAASGSCRVLRGGSWYLNPQNCRVASRYYNAPPYRNNNYGFRLVCVPQL